MTYSATYDPADDKLRLSASSRLDAELYERVKKAGFRWAPLQKIFYSVWNPAAEDICLELAGEVGDEDTSLVDRAAERAERFTDYQENRTQDAERAHKAVHAIADNIPLGQPILVGHHSERHARRDAEKIERGMRKAVQMWRTAEYWKDRAAGAISHAKYKELPAVRARRIKGLEAEIRQYRARFTPADNPPQVIMQQGWNAAADAPKVPHVWCAPRGGRGGSWVPVARLPGIEAHYSRWIQHCELRLEYERAMLAEDGGTVTDKVGPEVGGGCKCWAAPRGGWAWIQKVNKVSVTVLDNWGNGGGNFTRTIPFDKLSAVMTRAQVEEKRDGGYLVESADKTGFFLLDAPQPVKTVEQVSEPAGAKFEAMAQTLKAGVQVVSAPQLFPTPPELAGRMVELADIQPGQSVLEPSAGTGAILLAIKKAHHGTINLTAVEVNPRLASVLNHVINAADHVRCGDFLGMNGELGYFDRILLNPPFQNGQDIEHIAHAVNLLKPGGRVVAICAGGPRQEAQLRPVADTWEPLPAGTFKESGTGVNTVLLTINRDPEPSTVSAELSEPQTAGVSLSLFPEEL